ncbi:integrase [Sporosarcina sp. P37]|uniref:tyrosine-type recombinase/integrase n=1 Tax=unclassified Sporosarcina TaxID=2647733 RepID=UPI000A17A535|nr:MULTISPECIES: site-specific integrase [unclassified Sporosarcina]ARK23672.1 integrase [Sporosarcina sp. P37]PID17320.1 integrase [Sporosarcina sp. P35]
MTKKKGIFDIQIEQPLIQVSKREEKRTDMTIEQALSVILKQLEVSGCRERTLYDYRTIVNYFIRDTKVEYLIDITSDVIYTWLEKMTVKNTTKLTRLKCFKAFLGRCFDNGWFTNKFWRSVNIKVDTEIKVGATDEDVNLLLSVLDYTKFLDLRNAAAVLLMYRCGLRIGTIARMKEQQVDFVNHRLQLDGEVMKNHKGLILPIDEQMAYLLQVMVKQNNLIRDEYKEDNNNLFITIKGKPTTNSITSNSIQKQLRKYTLKFGIENINPHALRRGFAKNLYAKSNDLLLVSKALGHNDLSVTTKYLHTELTDVADKLKDYL